LQAVALAAAKGVTLPKDFLAAAAGGGLRLSLLHKFIDMQVCSYSASPLPTIS
jgi:hypothetical protein